MPRKRPDDRLDHLVQCAAAVFTERGYRRTQMADVAKAMGVAPGTLYLYVQSKDALFDLVIQRAFVDRGPDATLALPLPTPQPEATLRHVRERFARELQLPHLRAALRARPADPRAELEAIVRELFATITRNQRGLKLIERSALDWPALAALYFNQMRHGLIEMLTQYLRQRIRQGHVRPVPDTATAARLILETVGWFALHRHSDPGSTQIDDAVAEETVVVVLGNAFVPAAEMAHKRAGTRHVPANPRRRRARRRPHAREDAR